MLPLTLTSGNLNFFEGLEYLGRSAFYGSGYNSELGISSVTFPNSLDEIGCAVFAGSGIRSVEISCKQDVIFRSDFLTENTTGASGILFFYNSKLNTANFTSNCDCTNFGQNFFWRATSLTQANFPPLMTNIPHGFLRETGLTSITIPSNITIISEYAFRKLFKT